MDFLLQRMCIMRIESVVEAEKGQIVAYFSSHRREQSPVHIDDLSVDKTRRL
jgi:hypothetical protein